MFVMFLLLVEQDQSCESVALGNRDVISHQFLQTKQCFVHDRLIEKKIRIIIRTESNHSMQSNTIGYLPCARDSNEWVSLDREQEVAISAA